MTAVFLIANSGYLFRKDQNKNEGGILFYIIEDIPFKIIEIKQLQGSL